MARKNRRMLAAEHEDPVFRSKFSEVFSIRQLIQSGIRSPKFEANENATRGVSFTPDGEMALEDLRKLRTSLTENQARFVVITALYREDLLVDVVNTDTTNLKAFLSSEVVDGRIRYPWLFDHILYDKAFCQFNDITQILSVDQTESLLTDTPAGVFQLGTLTVGPLGLLPSAEKRLFRPRLDLLLSHCSDPACNHPHVARLSQPDITLDSMVSDVQAMLKKRYPVFSDWLSFGGSLLEGHEWYDDFSFVNLPWLLGNGFSEQEVRVAAGEFLRRGGSELRAKLPQDGPARNKLRGGAVEIASRLSKPEALQILLLGSDAELVNLFDDLVDEKRIVIPVTEIRKALSSAPLENWAGAYCQCSSLGLRVVGTIELEPLARLRRLILALYESDVDKQQLAWMLGRASAVGGATSDGLGQEVERFIASRSPAAVLEELVFPNHDKLRKALQFVRAPHLSLPRDRSEDKHLIDRLLWRLGFPLVRFESKLQSFRVRLEQFVGAAVQRVTDPEEWRAQVRGAAGNLFPLTEEVLDIALAFTSWVFLSDHYFEKHTYNLKRARSLMATELSGIISTDEGPVNLDASGGNTLFPLIVGFLALRQRLADLLQKPHNYAKPEVLMAHYSHKSALELFPYRHRYFVLDAPQKDIDCSMKLFQRLGSALQQATVLAVRNGITHPKLKFPSREEIVEYSETLGTAVNSIEQAGLFPVIYATTSVETDAFGRTQVTAANYAQQSVTWHPSPALSAIKSLPSGLDPQILVPSVRLPQTDEILRFRVEEDSDYTEMWKDYPKRRPPTEDDTKVAAATASASDSLPGPSVHDIGDTAATT